LLLVSVLFAALVVGGVALTTYVVVSDGMSAVADDAINNIAEDAAEAVSEEVTGAREGAGAEGLTGAELSAEANRRLLRQLPVVVGSGRLSEAEYALYGSALEPVWFSDERALIQGLDDTRVQALETGSAVQETVETEGVLKGLFGPASLGVFIVHVPVELVSGETGVLDVAYFPERERAVADAIRAPMFTLAVSAMLIMVIMMQTSMGWVLKLVDGLRKAADSIDAGNLDVHLPEEGEHEIGELARSLNRLIDRLRRKAEAQTRFVADASHELATPVAGIRGYSNILRAWGADDPEVRAEAISAIDRESRRMARLCSDLLAIIRDERAMELKNVRFDLNVRCRETLAAAATRYIEKGHEFIGPEEGQLMMMGDPDRIDDAISILVDNAAKYTPPGGRVMVSTRRKRDTVIVEVADNGIGIPPEDLPNIFERFYRSDTSRSKETGFGLGLPIVKTIVDSIGATIDVTSQLRRGTTFTLRIPRGRV
jgi:signal transduction histidine kinase